MDVKGLQGATAKALEAGRRLRGRSWFVTVLACALLASLPATAHAQPAVDAGPDRTGLVLSYASSNVTLTGSVSGGVAPYSFSWSRHSGPAAVAIDAADSAVALLDPYTVEAGTYVFGVEATDWGGLVATDTVSVSVELVCMVEPFHLVVVPDSSLDVTAHTSHADGPPPLTWEIAAAPPDGGDGSATLQPLSSASVRVLGLVPGWYDIDFGCGAALGNGVEQRIRVLVNTPPTVAAAVVTQPNDAGVTDSDGRPMLRSSSVVLDAAAGSSDDDGDVLSFTWQQLSGPTAAVLENASTAVTAASDLQSGVYEFSVRAWDGYSEATTTVDFRVNFAPVLVASPASGVIGAGHALLDASDSYDPDPDGGIVGYSWEWSSSRADAADYFTFTAASSATTYALGLLSGDYNMTVTATDTRGTATTHTVSLSVAQSGTVGVPRMWEFGDTDPDACVAPTQWDRDVSATTAAPAVVGDTTLTLELSGVHDAHDIAAGDLIRIVATGSSHRIRGIDSESSVVQVSSELAAINVGSAVVVERTLSARAIVLATGASAADEVLQFSSGSVDVMRVGDLLSFSGTATVHVTHTWPHNSSIRIKPALGAEAPAGSIPTVWDAVAQQTAIISGAPFVRWVGHYGGGFPADITDGDEETGLVWNVDAGAWVVLDARQCTSWRSVRIYSDGQDSAPRTVRLQVSVAGITGRWATTAEFLVPNSEGWHDMGALDAGMGEVSSGRWWRLYVVDNHGNNEVTRLLEIELFGTRCRDEDSRTIAFVPDTGSPSGCSVVAAEMDPREYPAVGVSRCTGVVTALLASSGLHLVCTQDPVTLEWQFSGERVLGRSVSGTDRGIDIEVIPGGTKEIVVLGEGVSAFDELRWVASTATTDTDCETASMAPWDGSSFTSASPVPGSAVFGPFGAVDGSSWLLCYRFFDAREFQLYAEVTMRIVAPSITGVLAASPPLGYPILGDDIGSSGPDLIAAAMQPKHLYFEGPGVSFDDKFKWVVAPVPAYDGEGSLSNPEDFEDAYCGADAENDATAALVDASIALGEVSVGSNRTGTVLFPVGSNGERWTLCYKFGDTQAFGAQKYVLYDEFTVLVKQLSEGPSTASDGDAPVLVAGQTKQFTFGNGDGLAEGDRFFWAGNDAEDCLAPVGTPYLGDLGYYFTLDGSLTAFVGVSSVPPASSPWKLCYSFADATVGGVAEPFYLYSDYQLRVKDVYGLTAISGGTNATAVVGHEKVWRVDAEGLDDAVLMKWVASTAAECAADHDKDARGFASNEAMATQLRNDTVAFTFEHSSQQEVQKLTCSGDAGALSVTYRHESFLIQHNDTKRCLASRLAALSTVGGAEFAQIGGADDADAPVCTPNGATTAVRFLDDPGLLPLLQLEAAANPDVLSSLEDDPADCVCECGTTGEACSVLYDVNSLSCDDSTVSSANVGIADVVGWGAPDRIFRLQLDTKADVTLSTCHADTDFDTYIRVYDRCPTCSSPIMLAFNDEGSTSCPQSSTESVPSRVEATLDAGVYFVVVEGAEQAYDGSGVPLKVVEGNFVLSSTIESVTGCPTCHPVDTSPLSLTGDAPIVGATRMVTGEDADWLMCVRFGSQDWQLYPHLQMSVKQFLSASTPPALQETNPIMSIAGSRDVAYLEGFGVGGACAAQAWLALRTSWAEDTALFRYNKLPGSSGPSVLFDGFTSTAFLFENAGQRNGLRHWVSFDMGSCHTLTGMRLHSGDASWASTLPRSFTLQASPAATRNDALSSAGAWADVLHVDDVEPWEGWLEIDDFRGSSQFWRIRIEASQSSEVVTRLFELELFGRPCESSDDLAGLPVADRDRVKLVRVEDTCESGSAEVETYVSQCDAIVPLNFARPTDRGETVVENVTVTNFVPGMVNTTCGCWARCPDGIDNSTLTEETAEDVGCEWYCVECTLPGLLPVYATELRNRTITVPDTLKLCFGFGEEPIAETDITVRAAGITGMVGDVVVRDHVRRFYFNGTSVTAGDIVKFAPRVNDDDGDCGTYRHVSFGGTPPVQRVSLQFGENGNAVQHITCDATDGTFRVGFPGQQSYRINSDDGIDAVRAALNRVAAAEVSFAIDGEDGEGGSTDGTACSLGGTTMVVTFVELGSQPLLYVESDTPPHALYGSVWSESVVSGTLREGKFTLSFHGEESPAVRYDARASELRAALHTLPTIGTIDVSVALEDGIETTGPTRNWDITFLDVQDTTEMLSASWIDSSGMRHGPGSCSACIAFDNAPLDSFAEQLLVTELQALHPTARELVQEPEHSHHDFHVDFMFKEGGADLQLCYQRGMERPHLYQEHRLRVKSATNLCDSSSGLAAVVVVRCTETISLCGYGLDMRDTMIFVDDPAACNVNTTVDDAVGGTGVLHPTNVEGNVAFIDVMFTEPSNGDTWSLCVLFYPDDIQPEPTWKPFEEIQIESRVLTSVGADDDTMVAIVGQPKRLSFRGFGAAEGDKVYFAEGEAQVTCAPESLEFGPFAIHESNGELVADTVFHRHSRGGHFRLCYQFGSENAAVDGGGAAPVRIIVHGVDQVVPTRFVRGVEQRLTLHGAGFAADEHAKWVDGAATECSADDDDELGNIVNIAMTPETVSGTGNTHETTYRLARFHELSTTSSTGDFQLCYKYRDKEYQLYPDVRISVHLAAIDNATRGADCNPLRTVDEPQLLLCIRSDEVCRNALHTTGTYTEDSSKIVMVTMVETNALQFLWSEWAKTLPAVVPADSGAERINGEVPPRQEWSGNIIINPDVPGGWATVELAFGVSVVVDTAADLRPADRWWFTAQSVKSSCVSIAGQQLPMQIFGTVGAGLVADRLKWVPESESCTHAGVAINGGEHEIVVVNAEPFGASTVLVAIDEPTIDEPVFLCYKVGEEDYIGLRYVTLTAVDVSAIGTNTNVDTGRSYVRPNVPVVAVANVPKIIALKYEGTNRNCEVSAVPRPNSDDNIAVWQDAAGVDSTSVFDADVSTQLAVEVSPGGTGVVSFQTPNCAVVTHAKMMSNSSVNAPAGFVFQSASSPWGPWYNVTAPYAFPDDLSVPTMSTGVRVGSEVGMSGVPGRYWRFMIFSRRGTPGNAVETVQVAEARLQMRPCGGDGGTAWWVGAGDNQCVDDGTPALGSNVVAIDECTAGAEFLVPMPSAGNLELCVKPFAWAPAARQVELELKVKRVDDADVDQAVVSNAKVIRFSGSGISAGDRAHWVPDIATVDADCSTMQAVTTTVEIDSNRRGTFTFLRHDSGRATRLCYAFAGEPFRLYPLVRVTVREILGVAWSTHGASDTIVAGVGKAFTVVGVGVDATADELQWVPYEPDGDCAEFDLGVGAGERAQNGINTTVLGPYIGQSTGIASMRAGHPQPMRNYTTFSMLVRSDAALGTSHWMLCYRFAGEPLALYDTVQLRVARIGSWSVSAGDDATLVADTAKTFTFGGEWIGAGDSMIILPGPLRTNTSAAVANLAGDMLPIDDAFESSQCNNLTDLKRVFSVSNVGAATALLPPRDIPSENTWLDAPRYSVCYQFAGEAPIALDMQLRLVGPIVGPLLVPYLVSGVRRDVFFSGVGVRAGDRAFYLDRLPGTVQGDEGCAIALASAAGLASTTTDENGRASLEFSVPISNISLCYGFANEPHRHFPLLEIGTVIPQIGVFDDDSIDATLKESDAVQFLTGAPVDQRASLAITLVEKRGIAEEVVVSTLTRMIRATSVAERNYVIAGTMAGVAAAVPHLAAELVRSLATVLVSAGDAELQVTTLLNTTLLSYVQGWQAEEQRRRLSSRHLQHFGTGGLSTPGGIAIDVRDIIAAADPLDEADRMRAIEGVRQVLRAYSAERATSPVQNDCNFHVQTPGASFYSTRGFPNCQPRFRVTDNDGNNAHRRQLQGGVHETPVTVSRYECFMISADMREGTCTSLEFNGVHAQEPIPGSVLEWAVTGACEGELKYAVLRKPDELSVTWERFEPDGVGVSGTANLTDASFSVFATQCVNRTVVEPTLFEVDWFVDGFSLPLWVAVVVTGCFVCLNGAWGCFRLVECIALICRKAHAKIEPRAPVQAVYVTNDDDAKSRRSLRSQRKLNKEERKEKATAAVVDTVMGSMVASAVVEMKHDKGIFDSDSDGSDGESSGAESPDAASIGGDVSDVEELDEEQIADAVVNSDDEEELARVEAEQKKELEQSALQAAAARSIYLTMLSGKEGGDEGDAGAEGPTHAERVASAISGRAAAGGAGAVVVADSPRSFQSVHAFEDGDAVRAAKPSDPLLLDPEDEKVDKDDKVRDIMSFVDNGMSVPPNFFLKGTAAEPPEFESAPKDSKKRPKPDAEDAK